MLHSLTDIKYFGNIRQRVFPLLFYSNTITYIHHGKKSFNYIIVGNCRENVGNKYLQDIECQNRFKVRYSPRKDKEIHLTGESLFSFNPHCSKPSHSSINKKVVPLSETTFHLIFYPVRISFLPIPTLSGRHTASVVCGVHLLVV